MKNQVTINGVTVTLTPAKTEARANRQPFEYNRFDVQQFADKDNPMAILEIVAAVVGYDVANAMLQQSLDRAFQACQKESGNDTLTADAKLDAAIAYMTEAKFGLSKSTSLSPSERIVKAFESTKKSLVDKLKAKSITHADFAKEIAAASITMTNDLNALPTEPFKPS
jgi:hypothetical protein